MQGYIKVYRKLMDSPVWSDPYYLKLWMYCLMKASHKEREIIVGNNVITLEPGQFLTGRNSLADDLNKGMKPKLRLSGRTWYRYLENLEKWQMLTIKKTNKYSVVSITKWKEYQETDQQLSNKSPSDDQQLSTNKNDKNDNNELFSSSSSNDEEFAEVMNFYQMNLQKGVTESPYNYELIDQWYEEWGSELLLAAMKLAAQREAKGTSFVEGVLKNWKNAGVKTVDDARKHETEFRNQKRNPYKNNVVPLKNREPQYDDYDYGF